MAWHSRRREARPVAATAIAERRAANAVFITIYRRYSEVQGRLERRMGFKRNPWKRSEEKDLQLQAL